jgi:hypothetical protein
MTVLIFCDDDDDDDDVVPMILIKLMIVIEEGTHPRPSLISIVIALDTTSLLARSLADGA